MHNYRIGDKIEVLSPAKPNEKYGTVNAGPYKEAGQIWWGIRFEEAGACVHYCLTPDEFKLRLDK